MQVPDHPGVPKEPWGWASMCGGRGSAHPSSAGSRAPVREVVGSAFPAARRPLPATWHSRLRASGGMGLKVAVQAHPPVTVMLDL